MAEHETPHPDLAGYLLGVVEVDERDRFERHLGTCGDCRQELAELRGLPELLLMTSPEAAPPAGLRAQTLAAVERAVRESETSGRLPRPRHRRAAADATWLRIVMAAAASVLAVVVAVPVISGRHDGQAVTVELAAAAAGSPAGGEAQVRTTDAGREVRLSVTGLPPNSAGTFYECWFVGRGDTIEGPNRVSAGTFTVGPDGRAQVQMVSAADLEHFPRMGVTLENDGGDPARHGDKVLLSR